MKFEKWVPVGISAARERWWLLSGIGIPLLMGVGFLLRYSNACQYLYRMVNGRRELIDGAKIPDFIELLRPMLSFQNDALHTATGRGWWLGRPVERPGSNPVIFELGSSIGSVLAPARKA